ncbi:MAG: glycoside hydrolase family 3 C-terminal domain-containing protein, partial [Bifidobacteriaceae bacterium]|nr:glycoside hydrolase family 3 C-terminal domain-containing protein [Bifidobacteriaceae bacterium]
MYRPQRKALVGALATAGLVLMGGAPALGAQPDDSQSDQEIAHGELAREVAGEGMVLLFNDGAGLPAPAGNLAVFGVGAYQTVKGGTGSGDVDQRYVIGAREGLEEGGYNVTTSGEYYDAMVAEFDRLNPAGASGGMLGGGINYVDAEVALTPTSVKPTSPTGTALYVLPRNSGEGADRTATQGDYFLSDTEYANIKTIGQTYSKVVVALNVGAVVDTVFVQQINAEATDPGGGLAVDTLLLMSQAGQESGRALYDVVSGAVNPSGKTVDTWASSYDYYPAAPTFASNDGSPFVENYPEGIYVGYRYFDSFYKTINRAAPDSVVSYPFGHGGSYTTFDVTPGTVTADADSVTIKATVSNTGKVAGKEVVQVYFSAPTSGLDKPYQELAAYGKTDLLAPGKAQTLTLSFPTTEMSSYNETLAAYVLEGGQYAIRVGTSSRDTTVVAKVSVASTVLTERLRNEVVDERTLNATQWQSNPANFYSYPAEARQISAAPTIAVSGFATVNNSSPYEQTVSVGPDSPFYEIDGSKISTATALIDQSKQANWEGTGAPYAPKQGETVQTVNVPAGVTLYDVAEGTATMNQFVASLDVEHLGNIVEGLGWAGGGTASTLTANGAAGYTTNLYEAIGIASMSLSDGPAGLRITQSWSDPSGGTLYQFCTAWPIGTALAQTWNTDLVQAVGKAIGEEMVTYGATLWLAPGQNIHRDPLNGRNFEYFSEDPLVTGLISAAETKGVQSNAGVGVTLKHYAGNNQESERNGGNSVINERALREIYLKGFEISVKSAQPMAIMSSYNQINGHCVAGDYDLLTDILRGEWGFKGLVMTDWGGCGSLLANMYAGNDLIEPGGAAASVVQSVLPQEPQVDVFGLPPVSIQAGFMPGAASTYTVQLGNLELSASGPQSFTNTVDTSNYDATPISGTTSFQFVGGTIQIVTTPIPAFASVQAAYDFAQALASGTNPFDSSGTGPALFTADQRAAIVIDAENYVLGELESFNVTLKGDYVTPMRLGDLQLNAARILNVVMQSAPFAELAASAGHRDIEVGPYTAQFADLASYAPVAASVIVNATLDTAALDAAIRAAQTAVAGATSGSAASLATAIAAATQARANAVTQADIVAALAALSSAADAVQAGLVPRGDATVLNALVAGVGALNAANFTPASWAGVQAAAQQAQAVLANPAAASQTAVDAAASALAAAIGALAVAPTAESGADQARGAQ